MTHDHHTRPTFGGRPATLISTDGDVDVYVLDPPTGPPPEPWACPQPECTYTTTGPKLRRAHETWHATRSAVNAEPEDA